jgi:hypothetical protein
MSRKILVVSLVLLVVGLGVLVYSDPLARLSFGASRSGFPVTSFTRSTTFTFTGGNFTIPSGGLPGRSGLLGGTTAEVATLVAIAVVAVGLVLEVLALLMWQGGPRAAQQTDLPQAEKPT